MTETEAIMRLDKSPSAMAVRLRERLGVTMARAHVYKQLEELVDRRHNRSMPLISFWAAVGMRLR